MDRISSFAERLTDAMSGMTVSEFARFLGISKQSVSAYLSGNRCPKRLTISAIAQSLDLNPAWLMGYDVPKRNPISKDVLFDLSPMEKELIDMFRNTTEHGRMRIISTVVSICEEIEKNASPADSTHTAG